MTQSLRPTAMWGFYVYIIYMYVKVRVVTKAKKERLIEVGDNRLEIHVKEKPEQNMANKRVLEVLKEYFGHDVKIISGHHHPIKMVYVNVI